MTNNVKTFCCLALDIWHRIPSLTRPTSAKSQTQLLSKDEIQVTSHLSQLYLSNAWDHKRACQALPSKVLSSHASTLTCCSVVGSLKWVLNIQKSSSLHSCLFLILPSLDLALDFIFYFLYLLAPHPWESCGEIIQSKFLTKLKTILQLGCSQVLETSQNIYIIYDISAPNMP